MKHLILIFLLSLVVFIVWKRSAEVRGLMKAVAGEYAPFVFGALLGLLAGLVSAFFSTAVHIL